MDIKYRLKKLRSDVRSKINEYIRVLKIAEKPDWEEYSMAAKITLAGTLIIGTIGFLFFLVDRVVFPAV